MASDAAASPAKEADSPLTDAYGARRVFWVDLGLSILLGGAIGALAFCFLSFVTHVTDVWMGADSSAVVLYRGFPNNLDGVDVSGFGTGPAWWLGITAGGGLIVPSATALLRVDSCTTAQKLCQLSARNTSAASTSACKAATAAASVGVKAPL